MASKCGDAHQVGDRDQQCYRDCTQRQGCGAEQGRDEREGDVAVPAHHALEHAGVARAGETPDEAQADGDEGHDDLRAEQGRRHGEERLAGEGCDRQLVKEESREQQIVDQPLDRGPPRGVHDPGAAQAVAKGDHGRDRDEGLEKTGHADDLGQPSMNATA